ATYVSSFFLPAFAIGIEGKREVHSGAEAFGVASLALLNPYFGGLRGFVPWLANPFLWVGLVRFALGRAPVAGIAGPVATCLAATLTAFFVDPDARDLILIGYYVWLASIAMFTAAAAIKWAARV